MTPAKINFKIYQGSTFSQVLRWESSRRVYKTITSITNSAPCIITVPGHEVPENWRVKVTNVSGMTDINSSDTYLLATIIDTNNIELNSINSVGYKTYTSGGILEYNEPVDITNYTARMQLRAKVDDDTVILELTTENGGINIDSINKTITITITPAQTELLTFTSAVYGLELESPGGVVTPLAVGVITLSKEVTR